MKIEADPPMALVRELLTAADLLTDDLTVDHLPHFYLGKVAGETVGVVGIEPHGTDGLLRSLTVVGDRRGDGVGAALVAAAETRARKLGIHTLYLLTETAEGFFERQGYASCAREQAPAAIRRTPEFAGLCPQSAVLMRKSFVSKTKSDSGHQT